MKDYRSVKEYEELHGVTWDQLAELEPELAELLKVARMVGDGCRKWHDVERGFNQFKNDIVRLVGFCGKHRDHPILGTQAAYDVVYWKLRNAVACDPRDD